MTIHTSGSEYNRANTKVGVEFIRDFFGHTSSDPVFISSLANEKNNAEKRVTSRKPNEIAGHMAKWDRPGRGLFFCVGTLKKGAFKRNKENVSEIVCLHADIDFKSIECQPDDVYRILDSLELLPSVVVNSGNGVHAYWSFRESIPSNLESMERVEAALEQLADFIGGDLQCCEISRLMRLPGSHNTKNGTWTEVTVVCNRPAARYELEDLEEWLSRVSPVIHRKPADGEESNPKCPYLAYAAEHSGWKAPIDVEQRLRGMRYQGVGDSAIHATQLAVSASLLRRGEPVEQVVDVLLNATRAAAGQFAARWNWRREERGIRKMCEDWLKKHPAPPAPPVETNQEEIVEEKKTGTTGGAEVHSLDAKRQEKAEKAKAAKPGAEPPHVALGKAVIGVLQQRGLRLLVTDGQLWRYSDGLWSSPMLDGRRWLEVEIERGARALGITSNIKIINETRQWILRNPDLYKEDIAWDSHGKIPTKTGLIDPVDPKKIELPHPEHYATWRLECEYQPDSATCPNWLQMLNDFFGDRPEPARDAIIALLQEIFGTSLVDNKNRSLTRALILQGPSESGKSQVLEVLSGMHTDRAIATQFAALNSSHGLMEFTRRAPWVLHEAFEQSQWHLSSIVKSILTGDPIQINIKNGPILTQIIKAPAFWGTNHPPAFKEMSKAIVNRMQIIKCGVVFDNLNPTGTAKVAYDAGFSSPAKFVLAKERSGILNWGVQGLRRAMSRGHLQTTEEVEIALEDLRTEHNIAVGFVKECCEYDKNMRISVPDFCAAFTTWWQENKGEDARLPSNDSIGRAMAALGDHRIAVDKHELRDNSYRYYAGIVLDPVGMDYWRAASTQGLARGKTSRISSDPKDVNKPIPAAWDDRPSVMKMRAATQVAATAKERGGGVVWDVPGVTNKKDTGPLF